MAQKYSKQQIQQLVVMAANKYGVNPKLALAVAQQESGFNPNAKSSVGARGVMQLMPNTAKGFGIDINNVEQNIEAGIRMLAGLQKKYGNDIPRVLAAYNAGSGAVDDYLYGTNKTGQNPLRRKNAMPYDGTGYKETKNYVKNIISMATNPTGVVGKIWDTMKLMNPNLMNLSNAYRIATGIPAAREQQARNVEAQKASQIKGEATGEAANVQSGLPSMDMSDLSNIELPQLDINIPNIGSPSGIPTEQIAQSIVNDLPTQFEQDYRDYVTGRLSKAQFVALHGNELKEAGVDINQLQDMPAFRPSALNEADRIARQIGTTPEQINQVQQQGAEEIARQREFAAQQGQGMVDRLNAIQQQYNDIINSDPRLQTGQGYSVDPRQLRNADVGAAIMQGRALSGSDIQDMANREYYAQMSNQLGVPYADYVTAKQDAIKNQLAALQQYRLLQDNINTNQAGMVNELSKVVQKANELGIGALNENEKQLVELYKGVLSNMTTGEYGIQKDISNRYRDIAGDRRQGLGNLYTTDVGAMTTTTGNILQNQANQQRNMYGFLTDAQGNYIKANQLPYQNFSYLGQGLGYSQMGGLTPQQSQALLQGMTGVQLPQQETYQPQGLQWR